MTVAGYPRYESYKDSGVEWIGEIPTSWKQVANKYLFRVRKEQVGKRSSEYDLLSLTLRGIIKRNMENPEGKFPAEFDTYQEVRPGDFVFCQFDVEETPRAVGLSSFHGMITGAYTVYELESTADKGFFYYFYLNADNGKKLRALYKGLRNTIPKDSFSALKTPFPSLIEQRAISAFLDEKCAKIDEAIRIKEEQIKLLHERRQILIQQAVTRGLNPDAPMKDSGIDWIGQIPAHWEVKRIKHVSLLSPTRSMDGIVPSDKSVIFLPMEAISENGQIDQSNKLACRDLYSGFTYFQRGDVVIAKITPCFENGKGAWLSDLESEFGFGTTELHVLRPQSVSGSFLYRVLNTKEFRLMAEKFMTGSAGQKRVPTSFLENHQIALPPEKEQEQIINFIDSITDKHRVAVSIKDKQITTLKEYKTTLINAAVTGKIRITPDMLSTSAN